MQEKGKMLRQARDVSLVREPALWTPRQVLQQARDFSPPQHIAAARKAQHHASTFGDSTYSRTYLAGPSDTSSESDASLSLGSPTASVFKSIPTTKKVAPRSSFARWWTAGEAFVVGAGDVGQLGLGPDVTSRRKWAKVPHLPDLLLDICCGGSHTLLLTTAHQIYTFGNNDDGGTSPPSIRF